MPALARKITPDYYDHHTAAAPRSVSRINGGKAAPRARWHEEKPATFASPSKSRGSAQATSARRAVSDTSEVQDLLSHFGHGDADREAKARMQLQARRESRRRARLRHRPFHMSVVGATFLCAPLTLLASLLWLRSSALALSRHDVKLQEQITASRFELERTRKEIAAMNASPHLESWAKERGWRRATQKELDKVGIDHAQSTPVVE